MSRPRSFRMDLKGPSLARYPELYYQASTVPGLHLPHAWVGDATHKVSP